MDRLSYDPDERAERAPRPPEPAPPVQTGSLAWASAVGNQAVQRLARQQLARQPEEEEVDEAPPPEVEALTAAGIGPTEVAGLAAVDELSEDELPE